MKKLIVILIAALLILTTSYRLFSQSGSDLQEFGITAGGFTNFPANQNYLKETISVIYVAPYIRTGQHEFSAGIVYPLKTHALYLTENNIDPRLGAIAGYKFYVFNIYSRENLFIHYSLQYLRFKGCYDTYVINSQTAQMTEKDMYINNVIGLGYNLFFDMQRRFGLYYTLDYVISQTGFKLNFQNFGNDSWSTRYIWNNLSTHVGLCFKLTPLKRKEKSN
jgi:hypothetical protein